MKESKRRTVQVDYDEQGVEETPQILSADEKRKLILAHARSRPSKDPMQRMTVWGGVLVAMAGIMIGWWWTVGEGIKKTTESGSPEWRVMTQTLDKFTKTVEESKSVLKDPLSPTSEANAGEFSDVMKAVLEGNDSGGARNDLLAPHPAGSASSTGSDPVDSKEDSSLETQLIDPEVPGLEPDLN